MVDPKLGTKRSCESCGAKFYDLNKTPAVCPKCGHSFDPTAEVSVVTPRKIEPEPEPKTEDDEGELEEDENAISLDAMVVDDDDDDEDESLPEFVDDAETKTLLDDEDEDDSFLATDEDED